MSPTTLIDFLARGALGAVTTGLTTDELRALIGDPEDTSVSQTPKIWKYGSIQFAFDCHVRPAKLNFIGIYFRESPFTLPSSVVTEGWWPSVGTEFDDFCNQLRSEGIAFREQPELTCDEQFAIVVDSGVTVCFTVKRGLRILDSMQYYAAEKQRTKR